MKITLISLFVLIAFFPSHSFACTNGDESKILLVVRESDDGEEDKVVGEIATSNGSILMTSRSYFLESATGNLIHIQSLGGHAYTFDRRNARWGRFCFKAIFDN